MHFISFTKTMIYIVVYGKIVGATTITDCGYFGDVNAFIQEVERIHGFEGENPPVVIDGIQFLSEEEKVLIW